MNPIGRFFELINPLDPDFWVRAGNVRDWMAYVWKGPPPDIKLEVNNVYEMKQFSAKSVYQSIVDAILALQIPDVRVGPETIRESGFFSASRVYLKIEREFSQFLVCVAPAGVSYFVTVRKIDRFPHAKWFHYLFAALILGGGYAGLVVVLGNVGANVTILLIVALCWSLMRYAAYSPRNWFSDRLPEIPIFGCLYLRWFRPDSFFRQDMHSAFLCLVDGVVKQAVDGLSNNQAFRASPEGIGGPVISDLHQH